MTLDLSTIHFFSFNGKAGVPHTIKIHLSRPDCGGGGDEGDDGPGRGLHALHLLLALLGHHGHGDRGQLQLVGQAHQLRHLALVKAGLAGGQQAGGMA